MGGFPLCDAVYEDDVMIPKVQQMVGLQKQLTTANFYNYRSGVLHLLASKVQLDATEKQWLSELLEPGSLQRVNLFQNNFEGKEPLAVAIESQNMDFIEVVTNATASLQGHKWLQFFNIGSLEFLQTMISKFTPPMQTEYAKL